METLQGLTRKMKSAGDLHAVVKTMKALAAVNIHQYEEAVRSLDDYYHAVELGLRAALLRSPFLIRAKPPRETVLLILGSDQGMVGRFNEAIVDRAERAVAELPAASCRYWVAGAKAAGNVEERFGPIEQGFPLPSSVGLITAAVQELVLRFEQRQQRGEARLTLCYNVPLKGAGYGQSLLPLLPPDRTWLEEIGAREWPGRCLPLYTLPREQLFAALIGEYLFVALFRAFAASLAAENAARLAAMQRAEKNIEEMRDDLTGRYHSLRQGTITEELLDVIAGFEALMAKEKQKTPVSDDCS